MPGSNSRPNVSEGYEAPTELPGSTGRFFFLNTHIILLTECYYHRGTRLYAMLLLLFVVVVSHIQRIGCQPEKTTLHGGQSRSWSAEQGKDNKRKSLAAYPPPTPHTARSEKINKITRRIYRRYAGGRSRVRTRIPSFGSSTRPMGVASQNSTLPSAIIRFPVSLILSSPGDV